MAAANSVALAPPRKRVRTAPKAAPVVASPEPRRDPEPMGWLNGGSIPALDGLRALSIGMVLLAHASLTWKGDAAIAGWPLKNLGGIGVDLFFVISGFLITWLLLKERRRSGTISLRAFYIRRAWRILPAYFVFLAGLLAMSAIGLVQLTGRDWTGALTYTVNFLPGTSWSIGHLWSLTVEEHFYLLWPLLLVVLSPGRACALAVVYVVLAPVIRLLIDRFSAGTLDIDYCTPARIDTIAAGCLLAFLADHARSRRFLTIRSRRAAAALFVLLLGGIVLSNTVLSASGLYCIMFRRTFDACCFAGLVWVGVSHTEGLLGRLLNAAPLVWIGRLSYGLYLWQQPFLNPHNEHWACVWPVNLGLAVLCALLSFALIERPALRLREARGWGRA